jgi:hypothetical protein
MSLSRKTLVVICMMMAAVLLTSIYVAEAVEIKPAERMVIAKPSGAMIAAIAGSTDLKVDGIFGPNCKCDISDVDAVYMGRINVTVSNNYQKSGGLATQSELTVTYHDLRSGQLVTVKKQLPVIKPYPTNPWVLQEYQVVTSPVLVKKSVGIKAEIKPTSPGVSDSDNSNNSMTVRKCEVMIY